MDEPADAYSVITVTSQERPADRFVSANVQPINQRGKELTLLSVVEVSNRWNPAIEIGTGIPQTFVRAFNRSQNRSILTKFEDALKAVNQFLAAGREKVSEPIHCALAIISDRNIYFSTINNGHLLLWRASKLTQITGAGLADENFSTVTSGELQTGDWLIGASEGLRFLLKNADHVDWVNQPKDALLRQLVETADSDQRLKLAGVCLEPASETSSRTIEVTELESRLPIALPKMRFNSQLITGCWQKLLNQLATIFKNFQRQPVEKNQLPINLEPDETAQSSATEPTTAGKKAQRPLYWRLALPVLFLGLLAAGVVLIVREFKSVSKPPTVTVPNIAELLAKTEPKDLFSFIEQNLTVDNYQGLKAKQQTSFNQVLVAQHIELVTDQTKAADLANPVIALDNTPTNLYVIDSTGQLWKGSGTFSKVTQQSLITNPISLAALADNKVLVSDQAGTIWLFDGSANQPINLPLPSALTQGQKLLQKFGSSNLYIYSATNQAIYKVGGFVHDIVPTGSTTTPAADGSIPPPPPWIGSGVLNFGTLVDWAVPGDFIGATDKGVVKNFTKNKLENLSVQYYADNNPIHISLTSTANQLAVARGKFVSVYSAADGTKINEKVLVTNSVISDVSPGPNNTLWVAAGKTLFKF